MSLQLILYNTVENVQSNLSEYVLFAKKQGNTDFLESTVERFHFLN